MSLFKSIVGAVAPIIGGIYGGPVGAAAGAVVSGSLSKTGTAGALMPVSLGALPGIGAAAGTAVRIGVAGVRTGAQRAAAWCKANPKSCAALGGAAAAEAVLDAGGLLPGMKKKRYRSRGITASQLKGFRRVHGVLSKFCAPRMKIRRRAAPCR